MSTNGKPFSHHPSTSHVQDDFLKDMKLQLQQLLLSTDFTLQSKGGKKRVIGTPSDDYLDQLAPIIKDSIKKDNTSDLIETLEGLQRLKDREINQICSGDHNEYITSLEQLSKVADESKSIKSKINLINSNISQSGITLLNAKKKYIKAQTTHNNINSAIEAVEACLLVLELTNNVHQLLDEKRKFAALKSLDDLRNIHLKEVREFGFAQLIDKSLPALTKMVRTTTISDIDAWLNDLNTKDKLIGEDIFNRVNQQRNEWRLYVDKYPQYKKFKFNSPVELSFRESNVNYLTTDCISIDLSILYEGALVHSSLGLLPQFQRHFENDRKIRRDYLIPNNLSDDIVGELTNIFHNITGFCIIDRIISRRLPTLTSSNEVDDIWESLTNKIDKIITFQLQKVDNINILSELKRLLGTLLNAMQTFDFDTTKLADIIKNLFNHYSKTVKKRFEGLFLRALQKDDYMPMVIQSPQEYDSICKLTWYKPDPNELKRPFPKAFPFSEIYPICCEAIQTFIENHQSFLEELQNDPVQIEDILQTSLDDLLTNVVCKKLVERLISTTREQIVQILINLEYFKNASYQLENKLANERISDRRGKITFNSTVAFDEAKTKAEHRMFELINYVVDNFLDLADYNWLTKEKLDEPSPYLVDMANFLTTMVNSALVNLPKAIKSFVYFEAFNHLSSCLIQFLIDSGDQITFEALSNFDLDVKYLVQFVDELSSDANDSSITTTLTPLRQTVDLLLSDDTNEFYNNSSIRSRKYNEVKQDVADILIPKISYLQAGDNSANSNGRLSQLSFRESISSASASLSPRVSSSSSKIMKMMHKSVEKFN